MSAMGRCPRCHLGGPTHRRRTTTRLLTPWHYPQSTSRSLDQRKGRQANLSGAAPSEEKAGRTVALEKGGSQRREFFVRRLLVQHQFTRGTHRRQLSVRQLSVDRTGSLPFLVRVEPLARQFGTTIRSRREAAGLTQEKLAELSGLHRTYISLLERGLRMPSILVVQQLARALKTTMASLLGEIEADED